MYYSVLNDGDLLTITCLFSSKMCWRVVQRPVYNTQQCLYISDCKQDLTVISNDKNLRRCSVLGLSSLQARLASVLGPHKFVSSEFAALGESCYKDQVAL